MPLIELHGNPIYYDRAGERGPRLLLVQGVGAVGEGWRAQIDGLAADHQLAWLDNRGIGRSLPLRGAVTVGDMAADALALLDHLGWQRAHLVGHSMGGLIVQEAARRQPGRVQSLSLLSTMRRGRDATRMSLSTMWASLRARIGPARTRWLRFAELAFPAPYLAGLGDEALLATLQRTFCADFVYSPPIVNRQVLALFRHTGGDMAVLQAIPTLVATGALDRVVRTEYSDDLLRHLPAARLQRIADAGHAVIIQSADAINRLLREHVAQAEAK